MLLDWYRILVLTSSGNSRLCPQSHRASDIGIMAKRVALSIASDQRRDSPAVEPQTDAEKIADLERRLEELPEQEGWVINRVQVLEPGGRGLLDALSSQPQVYASLLASYRLSDGRRAALTVIKYVLYSQLSRSLTCQQ